MHNLLLEKGEQITPQMRKDFPQKFTNPFSYIPHELCREAAASVQDYLALKPQWHKELQGGKMFGVLVVETPAGELGYLAAFSGNLQGRNNFEFFVPPVYDLLNPDEFFKVGEREISAINHQITQLEQGEELVRLESEIALVQKKYESEISHLKNVYKAGKVERERLRMEPGADLEAITKESQFQKGQIKRCEKAMKEALSPLQGELEGMLEEIESLKEVRRLKSAALQEEIFRKFTFLNALGEESDLLTIFREFYREDINRSGKDILPPGGAGECAAPKLLQYAFANGLRPIAMGEFWWGDSPVGEIRRHGEFYPSCKSKCAPILGFMLGGLPVDSAGVHISYGTYSSASSVSSCCGLEILYEDEYILAVNKPSGIPSVPGKEVVSVKSVPELLCKSGTDFRAKKSQQKAEIFVVHRLDMHTSGVLLVAKSEEVYKALQRQFAQREVEKMYVAVLDGFVPEGKTGKTEMTAGKAEISAGAGVVWESASKGIISLPLVADYAHRPAQIVDFENGKEAITRFEIKGVVQPDGDASPKTIIEFQPVTGRTHQLRVHSAHPLGLNIPIEGDLLYGKPAQRLMLHAQSVMFRHPVTGEVIQITAPLPAGFHL